MKPRQDAVTYVEVPYIEMFTASDNWEKAVGSDFPFLKFVGVKLNELMSHHVINTDSWRISAAAAYRIKLLNGPNYYTVAKAWLAIHGKNEDA